jgi:hypothetical protein
VGRVDGLVEEVHGVYVMVIELSQGEDETRLLEIDTLITLDRCQVDLFHFVDVAAGMTPAIGQSWPISIAKERKRKVVGCLHEAESVPAGADNAEADVLAPNDSHPTPRCRHRVEVFMASGRNEHPILTNKFKHVVGDPGRIDFDETHILASFVKSVPPE